MTDNDYIIDGIDNAIAELKHIKTTLSAIAIKIGAIQSPFCDVVKLPKSETDRISKELDDRMDEGMNLTDWPK